MLATFIIALREFFEAFLITGIFLGTSKKLNLKKEVEILSAAAIGIFFALLITTGTYFFGDHARTILTEKNADMLESYLLIFSGTFIVYVVFSLHNILGKHKKITMVKAHEKMEQKAFDLSLFLTIVFLILREGFEIALFTASSSLFSAFIQNMMGLFFGLVSAFALGLGTSLAYIKLPIGKVFKVTEYLIIIVGAALMQNGFTILFETHFHIALSEILSFHLQFLPSEDTVIGHLLQSFLGIDRGFSGARLGITLLYIGVVYFLFVKRKHAKKNV